MGGSADGEIEPEQRGMPRALRRASRILVRTVFGLLVVWLAAAAVCGLVGARSAHAGAREVQKLDLALGVGDLLDGNVDGQISAAHDHFAAADRLLGNPVLAPARLLPIAGRQLQSASALAGTAEEVLGVSESALAVLRSEIGAGTPTGTGRVASLERLGTELRAVEQVLAAVDLGPDESLIAPLSEARVEVAEKLTDARERTEDVLAIVDGMRTLLRGPSRYLVFAANNAEMRVGSGMFLSAGTMDVVDGRVTVSGDFEPSGELVLPEPIELSPQMSSLWGWSDLGSDYRSLGLSPRFTVNAELGARMWSALGRKDVDGALMIDVEGVAALLRIAGPVEVDGRRVDADGVVEFLLKDQYGDQALDDLDANDVRRDRLRVLAGAALDRFGTADFDLRTVLDELRAARDGRHLMAWSSDVAVQSAWKTMQVDGELDGRSLLVGLASFDTSKLDPYIGMSIDVDARRDGGEAWVELAIEIVNDAPEGLPEYVTGPDGGARYVGLVSAHLPSGASEVELDGFDGLAAAGPDGPTYVIAARMELSRGEARSGTLRFRIPASELEQVRIEPSARIPPALWDFGGAVRPDESIAEWPPHIP